MQTDDDVREIELLNNLRQGDKCAFSKIYDKHSITILNKLEYLTKDVDDASDLLQEIFITVWEKRESIDPTKSFKSFLNVLAKNLVIDLYRSQARIIKLKVANQLHNNLIVEHTTPQTILNLKEADSVLKTAIENLPQQQRHVFTLIKLDGKSYKETAELLNISPSTVKNHLAEAIKSLKNNIRLNENLTITTCAILCTLKLF